MQIYPEKLSSHLKQKLLPIYLLSGDEPLLLLEATDEVRKQALNSGYSERSRYQVDKNFDWLQLTSESNSLSLFAEQKLVEIHFPKTPDRNAQKQLTSICNALTGNGDNFDTLYLITCPKLDKRKQSAAWYKAIDNHGATIQAWPIALTQMPRWLQQKAQQLGFQLEKAAADLLANYCEGNLLAAKQELSLLSLLHPEQSVSAELMMESIGNNARYSSFQLLDAALSGDGIRAERILNSLKNEGVPIYQLLTLLSRECQQLAEMSFAVKQGKNLSQVLKEFRVWSNRQTLITAALNRLPYKAWQNLVTRCAHLDKAVKGMAYTNIWDEFSQCLWLIAGIKVWKKII